MRKPRKIYQSILETFDAGIIYLRMKSGGKATWKCSSSLEWVLFYNMSLDGWCLTTLLVGWSLGWLVGCCADQWPPHCHKLDCWVPSCGFPSPPLLCSIKVSRLSIGISGDFLVSWLDSLERTKLQIIGKVYGGKCRVRGRWVACVNWPLPKNETLNGYLRCFNIPNLQLYFDVVEVFIMKTHLIQRM